MARDFTKNTSNYMRLGANAIGALINGASAVSLHAWIYPDTISTASGDNNVLTVYGADALVTYRLAIHDGTNAVLRSSGRPNSGESQRNVVGTTNVSTGAWQSVGMVADYANDLLQPYYAGAAEGSPSVAFTATSYSTNTPTTSYDSIGSNGTPATTAVQIDGRIAEVAIWTSDIGATNFAALAAGISAQCIARSSLVFYMPLYGDASPEVDLVNSVNGTITGSLPQDTHPTIRLLGPLAYRNSLRQGI